jgi:hypothetical protein
MIHPAELKLLELARFGAAGPGHDEYSTVADWRRGGRLLLLRPGGSGLRGGGRPDANERIPPTFYRSCSHSCTLSEQVTTRLAEPYL